MTKQPPAFQLSSHGPETPGLLVLAGQVGDRVAHQVGQPERAARGRGGEVPDRDADRIGARLRYQPCRHGRGQLDPMDAYAAAAERQREAAGADAQFQSAAVPRQAGQEAHHRIDGCRLKKLGPVGLVSGRHPLIEVRLRHGHTVPGRPSHRQLFTRGLLILPSVRHGPRSGQEQDREPGGRLAPQAVSPPRHTPRSQPNIKIRALQAHLGQDETDIRGTRRSPARGRAPILYRSQPTWLYAPKQDHSHKPEEVYAVIERCSHGPYLELFARRKRPGWQAWGNEVASDVEL